MAYTTINKSTDFFNTVLYTGNTSAPRTISGVGFQPDWNWTKNRSYAQDHWAADAVRGSTKIIRPNQTNSETTAPSNGSISSFNADGYVLQAGSTADENYNRENDNYASWNWKAGTTSGQATNGDTTITPTSISFNQTSGFSIIKYTGNATAGAGVPHGLGVTPKMVMVKNIDSGSYGWYCYHASLGATKSLYLHNNDAVVTSNDRWNGWLPDATNVYLGTNHGVNGGSNTIIMYCFVEKQGYSKIGKYTGNGNADGTFIYTGFKPAFVIVKNTSTGSTDWTICDSKRAGYNASNYRLFANQNSAESTSNAWEMYSNGFKMTSTGSFVNASGSNYIYMAFAEAPLVGTNGVTAKAK